MKTGMKQISEVIDEIAVQNNTPVEDNSERIIEIMNDVLDSLFQKCEDISGAVISSADGNAWAERLQSGFDKYRFSAMSSALLALSDNLSSEANIGSTENTLIEGSEGKIFMLHAGRDLLLTVFIHKGANLGLALAYARQATHSLAAISLSD